MCDHYRNCLAQVFMSRSEHNGTHMVAEQTWVSTLTC